MSYQLSLWVIEIFLSHIRSVIRWYNSDLYGWSKITQIMTIERKMNPVFWVTSPHWLTWLAHDGYDTLVEYKQKQSFYRIIGLFTHIWSLVPPLRALNRGLYQMCSGHEQASFPGLSIWHPLFNLLNWAREEDFLGVEQEECTRLDWAITSSKANPFNCQIILISTMSRSLNI